MDGHCHVCMWDNIISSLGNFLWNKDVFCSNTCKKALLKQQQINRNCDKDLNLLLNEIMGVHSVKQRPYLWVGGGEVHGISSVIFSLIPSNILYFQGQVRLFLSCCSWEGLVFKSMWYIQLEPIVALRFEFNSFCIQVTTEIWKES